MPEANETYAKIQSIRVKNLEQQVHLMRAELQRIREGLLPQKDLFRLTSLSDKLKELNDVLKELKNHYSIEKSKQFQNEYTQSMEEMENHYSLEKSKQYQNEYTQSMDEMETLYVTKPHKEEIEQLPSNTKIFVGNQNESTDSLQQKKKCSMNRDSAFGNITENEVTDEEKNEAFNTCQKLMSDIKSPGSILGNYLVRLQDFRADPELRLQRIKRIQEEKEARLREKNKSRESVESPKEKVPKLNEPQQSTESIASQAISSEPNSKESLTSLKNEAEESLQNTSSNASKPIDENEETQCNETFCPYRPKKARQKDSDLSLDLLLVRQNLKDLVYDVVRDFEKDNIALTVVLETDQLYHVSVSKTSSGESLACFFSTEDAIQEAKLQNLFKEFLTLFVVNAENSLEQKDRILGHSFEFIKLDV